jgi:hypothetical protein
MSKLRDLFTALNLHFVGLAVILLLDIFLGTKVVLAMHAIGSDESHAFASEEIHYGQLKAKMAHIHDLPAKVDHARKQAAQFIDARIAPNNSTIAAELGNLASQDNVRLANAQYTYTPIKSIASITQVQIDASLSGQYAPLMHFINDLERDKNHVFFIITGLAFSGQQGGMVNLRIRVDTFLRSDAPDIPVTVAPPSPSGNSSDNSALLTYPPSPFTAMEVR